MHHSKLFMLLLTLLLSFSKSYAMESEAFIAAEKLLARIQGPTLVWLYNTQRVSNLSAHETQKLEQMQKTFDLWKTEFRTVHFKKRDIQPSHQAGVLHTFLFLSNNPGTHDAVITCDQFNQLEAAAQIMQLASSQYS